MLKVLLHFGDCFLQLGHLFSSLNPIAMRFEEKKKMRKALVLIGLLVSMSLPAQENQYDLVVKVENVKSVDGKVRIALYDNEEKFLVKALKGMELKAVKSSLTFTFKGLKDGVYAISLFHDENENGKLDANFIGIPNEPYAFSNNATGMFGPPDFVDCKFEINGDKEIVISL